MFKAISNLRDGTNLIRLINQGLRSGSESPILWTMALMILGTESGSKWEIERFPTKNETSDTTERNLYGMFPDLII